MRGFSPNAMKGYRDTTFLLEFKDGQKMRFTLPKLYKENLTFTF